MCFSNLFVNKCTMLHMRWTHVLKWKECVSFVLTFIEQLLFVLDRTVSRTRWQMPGWVSASFSYHWLFYFNEYDL